MRAARVPRFSVGAWLVGGVGVERVERRPIRSLGPGQMLILRAHQTADRGASGARTMRAAGVDPTQQLRLTGALVPGKRTVVEPAAEGVGRRVESVRQRAAPRSATEQTGARCAAA
jgi:hypothetical protein